MATSLDQSYASYQPSGKVDWGSTITAFLLITVIHYVASILIVNIEVSLIKSQAVILEILFPLIFIAHIVFQYLLFCFLGESFRLRSVKIALYVGIVQGLIIVYFHHLLFFSAWFLDKSFAIIPSRELLSFDIDSPIPVSINSTGFVTENYNTTLDSTYIYISMMIDVVVVTSICIFSYINISFKPFSERVGEYYKKWQPPVYFKYIENSTEYINSIINCNYMCVEEITSKATNTDAHNRIEVYTCPGDEVCYLTINNYRPKTDEEKSDEKSSG